MIALQTCTHYLPKPAHVAGHLYSHVWDHVTNWSSSLLHRATPSVPAKGRCKAVPAHFDTVLVRMADNNENMYFKGTFLEGKFINSLSLVSYLTRIMN